ncbi:MAG: hypothetical protein ABIH34_05510 [Nanoarchaeota archaeon]
MTFLDTFSFIIKIQAIFLMLVVLLKLWYVDRTQQKTKLALSFERFIKYKLFKQALFFVMLTFIFGTASQVVEFWYGKIVLAQVLSIIAVAGLVLFSYLLFKISSYTFEADHPNSFIRALLNTKEVAVPLVGGALVAFLIFFSPVGPVSATGFVVADVSGKAPLWELLLLLLTLGSIAMIVLRTIRK